MKPDVIQAARNISGELQRAVSALFSDSESELRQAVGAIKGSLAKVTAYVESIEVPAGKPGRKPGTSASTTAEEPKVSRRRKRGRFGITEFVLGELAKAGKALRPVELAARLSEETGRTKESAMANINTLLSRLRQTKKVTSKAGFYSATGSAKAAATTTTPPPTTKKTGKRGGRRKGGKRFQTGPFIIETLKKNSKGLRPKDVAKALAQAAPGQHKSPLSVVNTTLRRLKDQGQVMNKKGVWSVKAA